MGWRVDADLAATDLGLHACLLAAPTIDIAMLASQAPCPGLTATASSAGHAAMENGRDA
jgi:hypothetical protein